MKSIQEAMDSITSLKAKERFAQAQTIVPHLKEVPGVLAIIFFGSAAKNGPNPRDTDICIVHENRKPKKLEWEIRIILIINECRLGRPGIDLSFLPQSRIDNPVHPFDKSIKNTGIQLWP